MRGFVGFDQALGLKTFVGPRRSFSKLLVVDYFSAVVAALSVNLVTRNQNLLRSRSPPRRRRSGSMRRSDVCTVAGVASASEGTRAYSNVRPIVVAVGVATAALAVILRLAKVPLTVLRSLSSWWFKPEIFQSRRREGTVLEGRKRRQCDAPSRWAAEAK